MHLLQLPVEILHSIHHHIGGSELRKNVENLLVCKQLCEVAHPIYLELPLHGALILAAHDIETFPPAQSPLFEVVRARVTHLSLSLIGHPTRRAGSSPDWICFNDGQDLDEELLELEENRRSRRSERDDCIPYGHSEFEPSLLTWRPMINEKLANLSIFLPAFSDLTQLVIEASSDTDGNMGRRWNYLYADTLQKLINNLPPSLKMLTLDTCGTDLISKDDSSVPHLCPALAARIPDLQVVRIRMRCICPDVIPLGTANTGKLESVVIRLCLPMFPDYAGGGKYFDSERCSSFHGESHESLIESMVTNAQILSSQIKSVRRFKISYRERKFSGINLIWMDCLTGQEGGDPSEVFCYEDDGDGWHPWEETSD